MEPRVVASGGRFREDIYSSALLFSAASGRRLTVANVSCADVVPSRKVAIAPALVYRNVRNNRFQFDRLWERWAALGSQPIPRAGSCEAPRVLVGDFLSFPKAGACQEEEALLDGGCKWKRLPLRCQMSSPD